MKKFWVFLVCGIVISFETKAIYPDLSPLTAAPQICAPCTAEQLQVFSSTVDYIKQINSRQLQKDALNKIGAHAKSYGLAKGKDVLQKKGKGLLQKYKNKKGSEEAEKPISYTRTIKKTKTDLTKVKAVQKAFKKYFLYVPSNNEEVQASYKEKKEQFIEDTTIELFITAKEMDKDLKVMLSQLDLIEKCLILNDNELCKASGMEDFNCQKDEGSEDEMCYRRNTLLAAAIYDTIMKNNEYLLAMRAQYEAVRSLEQGVKPKGPKKNKNSKKEALSIYSQESFAYASQEADEDEEEDAPLIVDEIPEPNFEFSDNDKTGMNTPLSGKEGDLETLATFQTVQSYLSDAIASHNLKSQLPDFKRVFVSYHNMEDAHGRALKQVYTSQQCVLDYLAKRYENSQKVWFDNCAVDEEDGYVCSYNPTKSFTDNSESNGLYDVMCPNEKTQKCYVLAPEDYRKIGGMSGWLVDMYLTAKDELSDTSVDADDYVVSATSLDIRPSRTLEPGTNVYAAENYKNLVNGEEILVDTYKENMRLLSRLNHAIGVKADEIINEDAFGKSTFGVASKPFPMWNDQMRFYDQYIDGKYQNIRDYFEKAPLFRSVLNIGLKMNESYEYQPINDENGATISVEEQRNNAKKIITEILEALAKDDSNGLEEIETVLAKEKADLEKATNEYMQRVHDVNMQRIALYKQLENVNITASNLNNEIDKDDSTINYATSYNSVASDGVKYDKDFQNPKNPHKTTAEKLQKEINKQSSAENDAENARETSVAQLNGVNASREDILNAIKNKERELKKVRSEYVLGYYNAQLKYKQDLDEIVTDVKLSEAMQKAKDAIALLPVLAKAELVVGFIRNYALIKVDETVIKLGQMKLRDSADSLYYAQNNSKVVEIHSDMLKKIMNPNITEIAQKLGLSDEDVALLGKYQTELKEAFSDICDEVGCFVPDNQYFVGLVGQEKDLAAPKAPTEFSSAPLREIFYFGLDDLEYVDSLITDELRLMVTDYAVIPSGTTAGQSGASSTGTSKIKIIKSKVIDNKEDNIGSENAKVLLIENSLLNSGIELPEIWKVVLSYRPFVQKDINLEEFLNHDTAESVAVARSGIYPCISGGDVIDVVPSGGGTIKYTKLINKPVGYEKLPTCQTIKYDGSKFIDVEAEEGADTVAVTTTEAAWNASEASELGNILQYVKPNLRIVGEKNHPIIDAMGIEIAVQGQSEVGYLTFRDEFLAALRNSTKVEDVKDLTSQYYLYNRVLFQNNQLGNYLYKMEEERTRLDSLNKLKNRLYSTNIDDDVIVNVLYKAFAEMGYDFDRQKFDLSNEDYYKQAENILNARKEKDITLAKNLLQDGNIKISSPEMEKRKDDLLKQIQMLETDTDEIVQLGGIISVEELKENIKTQKANNDLLEADAKKAVREREEAVYCSSYEQ